LPDWVITHLYKAPKSRGRRPKHPLDLPDLPPTSPEDLGKLSNEPVVIQQLQGPALICAFCKWCDKEAGPAKKEKVFARIDILRKHVRTKHLDLMASDMEFSCPYEGCLKLLAGTMHYLNHVTHEHGLYPLIFSLTSSLLVRIGQCSIEQVPVPAQIMFSTVIRRGYIVAILEKRPGGWATSLWDIPDLGEHTRGLLIEFSSRWQSQPMLNYASITMIVLLNRATLDG
jgi:hypothetical protein